MPNLEQDRTEEGVQFLFRSPLDDQRAENEVETTVEIFRSWDLVELTLSRKRAKNPAIIITGRIFTIASHTKFRRFNHKRCVPACWCLRLVLAHSRTSTGQEAAPGLPPGPLFSVTV